ncbi:MAG: PRC-barrel domain-containing protein [Bacteroidota bacterium]
METLDKELEQENLTGENRTGKHPNTHSRLLTATTVIGDKVYNHHDQDLGNVKDIMLNLHDGSIEYVVIEFGGFLGIGEKFFAVPFKALTVDPARHGFILHQDKDVLEKAPGFDKDHWPETNSHAWTSSSSYWGGFMGANTGAVPY